MPMATLSRSLDRKPEVFEDRQIWKQVRQLERTTEAGLCRPGRRTKTG